MVANEATLSCAQRPRDHADQLTIACVGDSITAGAFSSGGDHPYPQQLQIMLDAKYPGSYKVTNLGHCGITAPDYPGTNEYKALMAGSWDMVIVMLGTNDAKVGRNTSGYFKNCTGGVDDLCGAPASDPSYDRCHDDPIDCTTEDSCKKTCSGPNDFYSSCSDGVYYCCGACSGVHSCPTNPGLASCACDPPPPASLPSCSGAKPAAFPSQVDPAHCSSCEYGTAMTNLFADIRTVGPNASAAPALFINTPPPLWQDGIYGMSKPVINDLLPRIVPELAVKNGAKGVIDVYTGMGGVTDWREAFPADPPGCVLNDTFAPCAWVCDEQSCNQCHPNDVGYNHLAGVVMQGLGL